MDRNKMPATVVLPPGQDELFLSCGKASEVTLGGGPVGQETNNAALKFGHATTPGRPGRGPKQ